MRPPAPPPLHRRRFLAAVGAAAGAAGLSLGLPPRLARAEGKVVFYNWATYIDEETVPEFQDQTGVSVVEDFFADNDELFNKLRGGNPGYDIIVPSNDFLNRMVQVGMVQPLDHGALPNKSNIAARFLDEPFDPGRKHSMPYMWGNLGVGYRKSAVPGGIRSWGQLFESDEFSGRMAILSGSDEMISIVRKYLGYGVNDTDPDLIARAAEVLRKAKPHIKAIAEDNGQDLLAAGEVDVAVEYNGDIAQLMLEDDDIAFVVPEEGTILWEDVLAIPEGAPNAQAAHRFINHLLDARVGARIADYIQYATPNEAALALTPAEYRTNEAIFPPDAVLDVSEAAVYKGEEYLENVSRAWDEFLAS